MSEAGRLPGSFRDPTGSVFRAGGRIFRGITQQAGAGAARFLQSPFYARNAGKRIVATRIVDPGEVAAAGLPADNVARFPFWVEHEPIGFISFPYEWSFALLQSAALLHLDLHIEALGHGYDLKDATPYNIQFRGCSPVFIDTLSFQEYRENSYWVGYKQFCEQFLAPLALNAYGKVDFNHWFRGTLDGIDLVSASRLLPARTLLNPTLLANIHAQAWAMSRVSATRSSGSGRKPAGLPRQHYVHLLGSLRRFIAKLQPHSDTYWADYRNDSSYSDAGAREKEALVTGFLRANSVRRLLDLGCNTGYYSAKAIDAGVAQVIGTDFDTGALNVAARDAAARNLNITPVYLDICNPSPATGWNLAERASLHERIRGVDASISLAVMHHIVIGKNIPMEEYVEWLLGLAPRGLVEFVPKADPMVAGLLAHREDIFPDYSQERFLQLLSRKATVTAVHPLANSKRVLVTFATT